VHETTVRFPDELWAQVQEISQRNGTSAGQFVRDATVARLAVERHVAALRRDVAVELRRLDGRLRQLEDTLRRHGLR
jgi:DNA-binding transcriptional ArsR family regulator